MQQYPTKVWKSQVMYGRMILSVLSVEVMVGRVPRQAIRVDKSDIWVKTVARIIDAY